MANFFIDRPIFAWVIAIVIMLAGGLAIFGLPIAQYPAIAPTTISITSTYPGASAKALEDSVTQVIEQKMKGIDHLRYMASTSSSSGLSVITLTFNSGTDPDIAQVQVQNKLALATPSLPQSVQQQGVVVAKATDNFLMVIGLVAGDSGQTQTDLADYIGAQLVDPLSRVDGVGDIQVFGSQYALRIWLDPARLNAFGLTASDVTAALQAQNVQVSAGQLGGTPPVPGQELNATIVAQSLLTSPEQFAAILLKGASTGARVTLGDVARVEVGSESYDVIARYNGVPAAGIGLKLAAGANALSTAEAVRAKMTELSAFFPPGVHAVYPYDTTPFVKISIEEVVKTLIEAIILVFVVMYVFLQNFRATLIPTIAVPVVLLGTFGVLFALGYSINVLTMFAMVLAIGLLVDDAIVVVENVERVMSEEGLSPREATRKSMGQITGALVGIALVLSAVFVPMAFFSGSAGVIYRQFSVTIVSAMVLSVLVALVLTPALCATILKPVHKGEGHRHGGLFGWFNRGFDAASRGYERSVGGLLKRIPAVFVVYLAIVVGLGFLFVRLPTSFLPDEDQAILFGQAQLPVGATQERTMEVVKQMEQHFLGDQGEAVNSIFTVQGFSFGGNGQNVALAFVGLKDWAVRQRPDLAVQAVAGRAMGTFMAIKDAMVFAFAPPAVIELGNASGFDLQLKDLGGIGHDRLLMARNMLLGMAGQDPRLMGVRPNGQEDEPQYRIDIDVVRAGSLGLSIADINATLSTAWGGAYVNDFVDRGRIKKVYVQSDAPYRMTPEDLNRWHVRNDKGEMVPFSAFASARWDFGPARLERYNGQPSFSIQGSAAPGLSSGDAMLAMEELIAKLPPGVGYEWTGLSDQERASGDQAPMLYAISILVVFLCLAALYESWSIPFSVILVVPLGVIGAVLAASLRGLSNDIFFQVGLLTTVGLSAKNAILIVEFAKEQQEKGMDLIAATLEAVRLRLRPILMTSLAFILGVSPLVLANGAGSGGQNAIGTGVMGGMIAATVLGIFFVPVFFVMIRRLFYRKAATPAPQPAE
ncbi:efflux RND transporter permease subunit [Zavarzinia aquatilis]|uniref:Efflux pump membrane transporter n=1 Tax=Zavarzinia aquatilis TaxID=2211142 RepID=A0A317DX26_9PROT|nr:efflux RND transporter permease subunit [Zavarzinia aquatilis]PWR19297.1 hydrophobe/amphiphile efflux-1 family RND transporter [Zavarzinia aquatilis]